MELCGCISFFATEKIKMIEIKNLKKKYGTSNPFKLCKYLGILVIFADLGEIKGYSIKRMRKKLICINENLDYFSQKFVCAHELGHCLYHHLDEVNFFLKNIFYIHIIL